MAVRSPNCPHLKYFQLLIEHEHRDGNTHVSWVKSIQLVLPNVNVKVDKLLIIRVSMHTNVTFYWCNAVHNA